MNNQTIERDAQRTLDKLNRAIRGWNRRHPEQPVASVKFEGGHFSFECTAPGEVVAKFRH